MGVSPSGRHVQPRKIHLGNTSVSRGESETDEVSDDGSGAEVEPVINPPLSLQKTESLT